MKTARRTRRTIRTAGLVAVAAAAAFSMTACRNDDGQGGAAGAPNGSVSPGDGGKDTAPPSGSTPGGSATSGSTPPAKGGASTGGGDTTDNASGGKGTACDLGTTQVRFKTTGGTAPVILLKATNNGGTRCDLYGYPFLGYPDAQAPVPVGGDTPQAVVSLEPGESGYASLSLEEGSGNNMHREKDLTVQLADRDQRATGSSASLTAPGEGLALSDNSTVSYWNTTPEPAV